MSQKPIQSIFIADDDAVSRKKLCRIFQCLGFKDIREAQQGDEALEHLKERPADLVMLDWHMPGLNGLELLKAIRGEASLQEALVYFVTVECRRGQILAAVQAGASGYIMKPFSQDSIRQKLSHLLFSDQQDSEVQKNTPEFSADRQSPETPASEKNQPATL